MTIGELNLRRATSGMRLSGWRELAIRLDDALFNGNGRRPNPLGILTWPGSGSTPGSAPLDDVAAAIAGVEEAYAFVFAVFSVEPTIRFELTTC